MKGLLSAAFACAMLGVVLKAIYYVVAWGWNLI